MLVPSLATSAPRAKPAAIQAKNPARNTCEAISPTSNAVFQLVAAGFFLRVLRGERVASSELATDFAVYGDSPDVRWAIWGVTVSRGVLYAQEGRADDACAVLQDVLPVLEQAASWSPNYPIIIAQAAGSGTLATTTLSIPNRSSSTTWVASPKKLIVVDAPVGAKVNDRW